MSQKTLQPITLKKGDRVKLKLSNLKKSSIEVDYLCDLHARNIDSRIMDRHMGAINEKNRIWTISNVISRGDHEAYYTLRSRGICLRYTYTGKDLVAVKKKDNPTRNVVSEGLKLAEHWKKQRQKMNSEFKKNFGKPHATYKQGDYTYGLWRVKDGVYVVNKGKKGFLPETGVVHTTAFIKKMFKTLSHNPVKA